MAFEFGGIKVVVILCVSRNFVSLFSRFDGGFISK